MEENITKTTTAESGNTTPTQQTDTPAGQPTPEERTFSQAELDRIVSERLGREKRKTEADFAKREQELSRREFLLSSKETVLGRGYPAELLDVLHCADSQSLDNALSILDGIVSARTEASIKANRPPEWYAGTGKTPISNGSKDAGLRAAMGLKT